ncbi:MAG: bacterioferritin [Bdellovibrionales bacterium]|nr:bacterioferritin [Bdellovibrionales bacterium]
MRGNDNVIKALNDILTGELTAINQYFLHARIVKNWGYHRLAKTIYEESIEEMKHAQDLTDRVLFLEGIPNLQKLNALKIGENVEEQLKADLDLESDAIPKVKAAIELCLKEGDHVSRELLEHILVDEENHVDWLEAQLQIIKDIGIQNYLAQQMGEGTS